MNHLPTSPYLTPEEAGAYLRLESQTLNNMRWKGLGPNYRKHGGKVVYHRDDLDAWSRSRDAGDHRAIKTEQADG
ncbi:MAG: helix-turn-helix domain-containing protein [Litorimonas sp.]